MKALRTYLFCYPLTLLAAFYATWVAGRMTLGYWPRPSIDDPKLIGFSVDIPYFIASFLLVIGLPAFIAGVAFLLYRAACDASCRTRLIIFSAFSIGYMSCAIFMIRWDPLGVVNWFMD
jgi:hypothetical protein